MSHAANPRAPQTHPSDAPQESTGAITSDSLAAESIKAGGEFSKNENAHILSVKGSNSTFNTTDTSGATALHPAPTGAAREKQDALGLGSDEKGVTGVKYDAASSKDFSGVHNQDGYVGGSGHQATGPTTTTGTAGTHSGATGDSFADGGAGLTGSSATKIAGISSGSGYTGQGTGRTDTTDTSTSTSTSSHADTAPNYAATVAGNTRSEGELKPKGENLTEGDIPKTKTFTGNVGGDKDPGRVAEQGFQKVSAENAASAGGKKHGGSGNSEDVSTGGQFDVLQTERAP